MIRSIFVCLLALAATVLALPLDSSAMPSYYFVKVTVADLSVAGNHTFDLKPLEARSGPAPVLDDYLTSFVADRHEPQVTLSVDETDKTLRSIMVSFKRPASLVVPPFTIYAVNGELETEVDATHNEYVVDETRVWPSAIDDEVTFTLNDRPSVADLPAVVIIMIKVEDVVVTSFTYTLNNISEEMKEGYLWDLVPSNTSMSFKFLAKYHTDKDKLGIWISRKPPISDFSLLVAVGGKVVAHENVANVHPTGVGITYAVDEASKIKGEVTCVAHFYERERTNKALFVIKNYANVIRQMRDETNPKKIAEGLRFKAVENHVDKLWLQLKYVPNTRHVAAMVFQPFPMSQLMLTAKLGRFVLFREEESHIPEIEETAETQFGWYHVIPTSEEALGDLDTNIGVKDLAVELAFNARQPNAHPFDLMKGWISDYGGKVDAIALTKTKTGNGRYTLHEHGLSTTQTGAKGDIISEVPYRVLLSDAVVEANNWIRKVQNNDTIFAEATARLDLDANLTRHFMLMSFFIIIQPNHELDGTNWHLYFRTIPKEAPPLPHFYTKDELALFSFSPSVLDQVDKMEQLWTAEYETLIANAEWVANHVSYEEYRVIRGHVESRVFNITGTLVMAPVFDYLNHDDNASVAVNFDDKNQIMTFRAEKDLADGDSLTIDYGVRTKTKLDFLLQFGFIPANAMDGCMIAVGQQTVFLSESIQKTHDNLRNAVEDMLALEANTHEDDDGGKKIVLSDDIDRRAHQILSEALRALPRHAPKLQTAHSRSKHNPRHLSRYEDLAERLLRSERHVLAAHHSFTSQSVLKKQ